MADFADKLASLPAMTLRELRLLASRIGLGRYGALTRRSLMEAIRSRTTPGAAPTEAAAFPENTPAEPIGVAEAPLSLQAEESPADVASSGSQAPLTPAIPTSWIVLQPQADGWAEVRWQLSDADRSGFQASGASGLRLRLSDVSGGATLPHALQELAVDAGCSQWYLPIPLGDRTYRIELGYRLQASEGWRSLVTSSPIFVPAADAAGSAELLIPPFRIEAMAAAPAFEPTAPQALDLHERLYQVASIAWRRNAAGSEVFLESGAAQQAGAAAGFQASGEGFWASGRQESGAGGVAARQRSFWLVADAELIVHAATEPSALLKVGDAPHPLSEEGTIRFHVPFPDGEQDYPITAIAADGEQKRHVTLHFQRQTPHARTNRREEAIPEWF